MKEPSAPESHAWEQLAQVYATSRELSADMLVEWPAQLRLTGDFHGKHLLDVGCGTGDKARFFADNGAASVLGIDASNGFAKQWAGHQPCPNLQLAQGSFETLRALPQLKDRRFDIIVCYQALMYARDLQGTVQALAQLLLPGGTLTISVPHPFRFALLKAEIEGWQPGFAYQHTQPYRYPSPWKPELLLEHAMPRISDYLNAIASAGLQLTACEEPAVTDNLRAAAPEKAAWMDRYVGIIVFRSDLLPSRKDRIKDDN